MEKLTRKNFMIDLESEKILLSEKNKSEFVNKAIKFYYAYKTSEENNDFILGGMDRIVESKLEKFEYDFSKRVLSLISNLGIEIGIANFILSNVTDIDEETRNRIRGKVIEQISETNAVYKYKK